VYEQGNSTTLYHISEVHESRRRPTSGEQNYHKQKLWTSDVTEANSPFSGAEKHPDFQG